MGPTSKKIMRGLFSVFSLIFFILFIGGMLQGAVDPFAGTLSFAFVFNDIEWEGGDNIGGFTSKAWIAFEHEVHEWPTEDRNAETDAAMVELTGSYIFKEGKKFYEVYVTQRTGGAESENQGEIDGKSFMQKPVFFTPGTRTQTMAFARKINNSRGIMLMKDPNTGEYIQFGNQDFPLHFKPRMAFGNQPTDRRGLFVDCEADNFNAALIYKGTLTLSPAAAPAS